MAKVSYIHEAPADTSQLLTAFLTLHSFSETANSTRRSSEVGRTGAKEQRVEVTAGQPRSCPSWMLALPFCETYGQLHPHPTPTRGQTLESMCRFIEMIRSSSLMPSLEDYHLPSPGPSRRGQMMCSILISFKSKKLSFIH